MERKINELIEQLMVCGKLDTNKVSDTYHTFGELYAFRLAFNAALFNEWHKNGTIEVYKTKRHYDDEACFGGGWFMVVAMLPTGQISNHYELKDWKLFNIPIYLKSKYEFDGHTSVDVLSRIVSMITKEQDNEC